MQYICQNKLFSQLTTNELYDLLKLRVDVFVVEQTCYYPDLDELDRESSTIHILIKQQGNLLAYCRLLAPGVVYSNESAIGRVVVAKEAREHQLGRYLMEQAIEQVNQLWPEHDCKISAQFHLAKFYQSLGFEQVSEVYLEDGIEHIAMIRNKNH